MATMVSESHSGEHVRTFVLPDKGEDVIATYVERGFSVARCLTRNTVELVSGRAVVTVTWPGGESVVHTSDDRETIDEGQPAEVLAVAVEAIGLLPIYAGWGDSAEGVFEVVDGHVVEVVAEAA